MLLSDDNIYVIIYAAQFKKSMVNNLANGNDRNIYTITDDDTKVSSAECERINFMVALIGKLIEAREQKGLSQRELAKMSGVKQPAIARLESMKTTPQIDTLLKILNPLGYTIEIVPLKNKPANGESE